VTSPSAKLRPPGHPGILATLPDDSRYGENRGKQSCLRRKQWGNVVFGGEGGRGGARGEGRTCVRACTRRLTCPLFPNANAVLRAPRSSSAERSPGGRRGVHLRPPCFGGSNAGIVINEGGTPPAAAAPIANRFGNRHTVFVGAIWECWEVKLLAYITLSEAVQTANCDLLVQIQAPPPPGPGALVPRAGGGGAQIWVGACGVAMADDGNSFGFELISAA
jgi:hypothetical protein